MNRREALSILTSLPAVSRIEHATLQPSSVIVATVSGLMTREAARIIEEKLRAVWPDHRIVVLSDGMTLRIIDDPK